MDSRGQMKSLGELIDKNYGRTKRDNKEDCIVCEKSKKEEIIFKQPTVRGLQFKTLDILKLKHANFIDLTRDQVACFIVNTNSVENIYPDNGWRPMSRDKVLELQGNFIKIPNMLNVWQNSFEQPIDGYENEKFVKIIQNNDINFNRKAYDHDKDNEENEGLIKITQPPSDEMMSLEHKTFNCVAKNDFKTDRVRQAKKIDNLTIDKSLINKIRNKITHKEQDEKDIRSDPSVQENKAYEVEETLESDLLASDQKNIYKKGTSSEVSKLTSAESKNNSTENLLRILGSYNIRTGDRLPNYEASLRHNSRKSENHNFVIMPVPVKIPFRYNNANHLPIDPLLAVFLSNYGHYLPTLYGFNRGYNNLYGYLASNNIHNNKPFGNYKIFSDTDSSH